MPSLTNIFPRVEEMDGWLRYVLEAGFEFRLSIALLFITALLHGIPYVRSWFTKLAVFGIGMSYYIFIYQNADVPQVDVNPFEYRCMTRLLVSGFPVMLYSMFIRKRLNASDSDNTQQWAKLE